MRWAREKLGLTGTIPDAVQPPAPPHVPHEQQQVGHGQARSKPDIRTFVTTKDPKSDMHFAATIAYFYRFEAPDDQRKSEINGHDLQEACRQVGRNRLKNPRQTLVNAQYHGLLDKGSSPGTYSINTVGENLVAMTLPLSGERKTSSRPRSIKANRKAASRSAKPQVARKQSSTRKNAAKKPTK